MKTKFYIAGAVVLVSLFVLGFKSNLFSSASQNQNSAGFFTSFFNFFNFDNNDVSNALDEEKPPKKDCAEEEKYVETLTNLHDDLSQFLAELNKNLSNTQGSLKDALQAKPVDRTAVAGFQKSIKSLKDSIKSAEDSLAKSARDLSDAQVELEKCQKDLEASREE